MTILTILLFICCILFLIGYRKERDLRLLAEHGAVTAKMQYDELKKEAKPKAMTAPVVKKAAREQLYHDAFKALADGAMAESAKKDAKQYLLEDAKPKIPRGYKRHDGGKMPVNYMQWVDIIQRNGEREVAKARMFDWSHDDILGDTRWADIIAYKIIKPTKKQTKKPKTMKRGKK